MNYISIAGLILLFLALPIGLIEWAQRKGSESFIARLNFSGFVVLLLSGTVWYLGNIYYGNNAAWQLILVWLEQENGEATLQPWLTNLTTATVINLLPSVGQWWRWRFNPDGHKLRASYALSAIDWAMNTIGFYAAYSPFAPPLDWFVFIGMGVAAYFPNFWCQEICQNTWGLLVIHFHAPPKKKKKYKTFIPSFEDIIT